MAGKTSRTHGIVCWHCDNKFEVALSLPKNAKKKNRVYNKWDSVKECGECGASTRLRLGYTKKQGVYVDYEVPIKEVMGLEAETSSNRDKIGSYFSRNYERGKRLPPPKGASGGWRRWKSSRLRKIGFYDKNDNRTKSIDDEPARIRLREESDLTPGHFEFKTWIQDKVEEAAAGEASPKFLANEDRNEEREEALESWERVRKKIEEIIDERIIGSSNCMEGRQLSVIRKINGRLEPSARDFHLDQLDKGFHQSIDLEDWWKMDGRMNVVEKVANEVARCLISHSSNTMAEDREVFEWRSDVNEGKQLFEFANANGCFVSASRARKEFIEDFADSKTGEIDHDRIKKHRERMGANLSVLHHRRRIRMTIAKLLEEEVEPPREWKWMFVWAAGISFFPDVRTRVRRHIESEGAKALEIYGDKKKRKEAGLDQKKFALEEDEEEALERFRNKGFGSLQGVPHKSVEDCNEHNTLKFVYNIIIEMKREGLLRPAKMTPAQYTSYYLDGDDSLAKSRGPKPYPNNLVFTMRLEEIIGKSKMEDFEEGRQNAIYRWLRGDRDRWMYCPPDKHEWLGGIRAGGLLRDPKISSNTSDYEMFEVESRDLQTGEIEMEGENPKMAKTVRCVPGVDIMRAMNTLQETQWEINLDLLERICSFQMDGGAVQDGGLVDKKDRIKRIVPKEDFEPAFFDGKGDNGDVERRMVLEWCRRIIEHGGNVFWHSWMCDFRGRMVPRCQLLSPQKGDLSRALLRFKEWKPMGERGRFWFHVHVHNLMEGIEVLDKPDDGGNRSSRWKSGPAKKNQKFEDRDEWVTENLKLLREIGRHPDQYLVELGLDQRMYSKRTDFQRLAALIELDRVWSEFERGEGEGWGSIESGQPVYLDASCNGYQHVASLLGDVRLARLTNVIDSGRGPLDLYSEVAKEADKAGRDVVREFLGEIGVKESLIEECLEKIFTRSLAKQPTIVRVYGSNDMLKCLEGRKGQGRPDFSMPLPRVLSEKEEAERKEITVEFEEAYLEFVEARRLGERLPVSHYQQHAKKKVGSGFSKGRADKWAKLLRDEVPVNLWAQGSGLHDAIIAKGGDLADLFAYPDGSLWEHQHSLSLLMKDIMMKAIGKATRDAYGKLEKALGAVTEACKPALWPGVYWDVMPGDEGSFRVHQYYIGRDGADKTKAGKPTHVGSVYSGLLPDWYKKNIWMGHKGGKSKARIALRACELYEEDESLAPEARKFLRDAKDRILEKGKRFNFESLRFETIVRQAGGDSNEAKEILGLMRQREYSIPNYNKAEKERVKGRKRKMNSSMPPNFVHSLDAYHMRTSINRMRAMMSEDDHLSFWAVHDAFGTHACDIDLMREIVKSTFFDMHQGRSLNDWTADMKWVGKEKTGRIKIGSLWKDPEKSGRTAGDYLIS